MNSFPNKISIYVLVFINLLSIVLVKNTVAQDIVSRLSKSDRQCIFTEIVKAEDRAWDEAEAKYPIDQSKIPFNQLKTYDWAGMGRKNLELSSKFSEKLENEF